MGGRSFLFVSVCSSVCILNNLPVSSVSLEVVLTDFTALEVAVSHRSFLYFHGLSLVVHNMGSFMPLALKKLHVLSFKNTLVLPSPQYLKAFLLHALLVFSNQSDIRHVWDVE